MIDTNSNDNNEKEIIENESKTPDSNSPAIYTNSNNNDEKEH